MAYSKVVALSVSTVALLLLIGCGGSHSTNPPVPPTVSIAFQATPPKSLFVNATAQAAAVVTNDPTNAGVNWSLSCGSANDCGSLVPGTPKVYTIHTASGTMVTYTPPSQPSSNSFSVTLVAFAAADNTQNVLAQMVVTGFAGSLKGTYVFAASGWTFNAPANSGIFPYSVAGVLLSDGNGNITGGEQTYADALQAESSTISGGTYSITADGTGSLTITANDPRAGNNGTEFFNIVILSAQKALIAENDTSGGGYRTASGTLDLQTTVAPLSGGYAFVVQGSTAGQDSSGIPNIFPSLAFGGVFNVDSPQKISGAGSVADENVGDTSNVGNLVNSAPLSGTVSAPDSLGNVIINLSSVLAVDGGPNTTPTPVAIQFAGYIIDASHIQLVETDQTSEGVGFGSTGGMAIGQGSATGTFASNSALSGPLVLRVLGQPYSSGTAGYAFGMGGLVTADGAGNLNGGMADYLSGDTSFGFFVLTDSLTGTYAVDPTGTGRAAATTTFATLAAGPVFVFYLTGNGNPALVLNTDANPSDLLAGLIGSATLGTGKAFIQSSNSLGFAGGYGFNYTQLDPFLTLQASGTGQISVDAAAGNLTGTFNSGSTASQPVQGTFTATSTGRLPGTLTGPVGTSPVKVAYYLIDATQGFVIFNDTTQNEPVVFLGDYAQRTPVCPTCN